MVFDCDSKTSREFNGLFLLQTVGGSEPCVSLVGGMTQLTAALMMWKKLLKLYKSKSRALFLRGFPLFKRINRVCRFDGFLRNLAKMFLGYQCVRLFDIPNIFPFMRFQFAKIHKYSIRQLQNRFSWQAIRISQSLTYWLTLCSLIVRASRKAGNSV